MTVQDIQSLVDLIGQSSTVTNIAVTAADGSSVSIKRAATVRSAAMVVYRPEPDVYDVLVEEVLEDMQLGPDQGDGMILAPLVGIFHSANPPLTEGSLIKLGQIVGYIESMRLMSEMKADVEGVVTEVLIDDRQPVEYAQPLFRIMPAEE